MRSAFAGMRRPAPRQFHRRACNDPQSGASGGYRPPFGAQILYSRW